MEHGTFCIRTENILDQIQILLGIYSAVPNCSRGLLGEGGWSQYLVRLRGFNEMILVALRIISKKWGGVQ